MQKKILKEGLISFNQMPVVLLITKAHNLLLIKDLNASTNRRKGTFIYFVIIEYYKKSSQFKGFTIHMP